MVMMTLRPGIYKAGNAGLVTATAVATGDLCHTMPTRAVAGPRTAFLTKINCYNALGVNVTLQFGTLDRNPAGAAFVALMPIFLAIAGMDNEWLQTEIPAIEWISNETLTAAGRTGDIRCVTSGAVTIAIEVYEIGL